MTHTRLRDRLDRQQIPLYLGAILVGAVVALVVPGTSAWEAAINPVLAAMLFVTFLQVPISDLGRAFGRLRFVGALLSTNFVVIPALVAILVQFAPADPMIRFGLLLVLLSPCIDYVVTFAQLGRADARLLLASTPLLLVAQMALLPIYLGLVLGPAAAALVQPGPFIHAFVWLIAVPLVLALCVQSLAPRIPSGDSVVAWLGVLPVPATALVLLVVIAAVVPQLGLAIDAARAVTPVYIVFAIVAPLLGWGVSRLFGLDAAAGRAVAFSAATRNSLVVLPLALAVPGAIPLLPAIIVVQTLIELIAQPMMIRLIPRLGRANQPVA